VVVNDSIFPIKIYYDLSGERTNTHGRATKPLNIIYQNLKLSQLKIKFKIKEINGYNMFGKWTETDCNT